MREMINIYRRHKNVVLLILGCLSVSMMVFPCLILGEASYVEIHDQLDGEVLNYIYRAKYLFQGDRIPEFMNGMSKASMALPAPFGVVFYLLLPPFAAYVAMWWMALITGFSGMFFLSRHLGIKEEAAFFSALLFACMPFYPVYGLASWGQPLLILCFICLIKGRNKVLSLAGIVLYAGFSSLSLVGFVWVAAGFAAVLYLLFGKKDKRAAIRGLAGWAALLVTYLLVNLDLLGSLVGAGFTTHRQEMRPALPEDIPAKALELLLKGGAYSKVYSGAVLLTVFFLLSYRFMEGRGRLFVHAEGKRMLRLLYGLLISVVTGIALAVLWNCGAVVSLRKAIGGIFVSFQADRIYWIFPFLWMLILACVCQLLWYLRERLENRILQGGVVLIGLALLLTEGLLILRDNTLNKNMRLLLLKDYRQVTWESVYMEDVFDEIDRVIGADKEKVSVVSLGIYPSVALYNGYTCADGYSNNYSLEYKHAFRRIMAEELEKDSQVRAYFDDWGNRLYLVSAEQGFNAMVGKGQGTVYRNLKFDRTAMKDLNIAYLLAAAPIEDSENMGFELLEGSPFGDGTSYYEVWVYRVKE